MRTQAVYITAIYKISNTVFSKTYSNFHYKEIKKKHLNVDKARFPQYNGEATSHLICINLIYLCMYYLYF